MGSQTLEILRQGVWASLTGGWFYDPHQGVFCNVVHLYLWLYLLCSPFVAYLYFPRTWITWCIYCTFTSITILLVKLANMALHRLYDRAQTMSEANLKNPFFKITKETEPRENEAGIEMKVMRNDGSRNSVEQAINEASEENSMMSMENVNSIIDLKVDVHRKNSSESIEMLFYPPSLISGNSQQDQQSLAGSLSVTKSIRSTNAPIAGGLSVYPEHESEHLHATVASTHHSTSNTPSGSITTARHLPHLLRKSSEEFKRRHQRRRLERQGSLDAAAESCIAAKLIRNQSDTIATSTAAARNETFLHPQCGQAAGAVGGKGSVVSKMPNGSGGVASLSAGAASQRTATTTTTTTTLTLTASNATATTTTNMSSSSGSGGAISNPPALLAPTKNTRLQRHRSSETHDERIKQQNRGLFLPIHHEHQPHHVSSGASSSSALTAIGGGILDGDELELSGLGGSASGVSGHIDTRVRALQSWILGSSSDVYIEDDSYTKSDFGIEQLDGRNASRAAYLLQQQQPFNSHYPHHQPQFYRAPHHHHHHHHGVANIRKDSNSTMSAIQLPVGNAKTGAGSSGSGSGSGMKRRRHSNATALYKSGGGGGASNQAHTGALAAAAALASGQQPTVRRIKSAALEISCPRPSVSNLSPHPNSVEAINGQQMIKNPQSALLPPPSKCLVRNPHLNLCPKFGGSFGGASSSSGGSSSLNFGASGSTTALIEPVSPIVEQSDERASSLDVATQRSDCALELNDVDLVDCGAEDEEEERDIVEGQAENVIELDDIDDNVDDEVDDVPMRRRRKALGCHHHSVESDVGDILADDDDEDEVDNDEDDEFKDFDDDLEHGLGAELKPAICETLPVEQPKTDFTDDFDHILNGLEQIQQDLKRSAAENNRKAHVYAPDSEDDIDEPASKQRQSMRSPPSRATVAPTLDDEQPTTSQTLRQRLHSTDSETDNNGSRSPLLSGKSWQNTTTNAKNKAAEQNMYMEIATLQKHKNQAAHHSSVGGGGVGVGLPQYGYEIRPQHAPRGEGDSGCPSSDCEQVSASSKDMLLSGMETAVNVAPPKFKVETPKTKKDLEDGLESGRKQITGVGAAASGNGKNLGAIPKVVKYREVNETLHSSSGGSQLHKRRGGSASGVSTNTEMSLVPFNAQHSTTSKAASRTSSSTSSRSISADSFSADIHKMLWLMTEHGRPEGTQQGINATSGSAAGAATSSGAVGGGAGASANMSSAHFQFYQDAIQAYPTSSTDGLSLSERMYYRDKARRNSKQISDPGNSSIGEYSHPHDLQSAQLSSQSGATAAPMRNLHPPLGVVVASSSLNARTVYNGAGLSIQGLINVLNDEGQQRSSQARSGSGSNTTGTGAAILNMDGHHIESYCDYWRPACMLSTEKPVVPKSYYKYRFKCCGYEHEFKISMDRLELLALFDRDLHWIHIMLAVLLCACVAYLGATVLQLGYYKDLCAFLFCAVIASAQYSLVKSVQPDAASPIHGFNKTVAYSRAIYFCICSGILLLCERLKREYEQQRVPPEELNFFGIHYSPLALTAAVLQVMYVFLLCFPIIFSLGLCPQINTFLMYLLEQIDMHVFGGNATGSLLGAFLCVLRSILGVMLLYGPLYSALAEGRGTQFIVFSLFCAILVPLGYHLSRSASDFSHMWALIKNCIVSTYHDDDDDDELSAATINGSAASSQKLTTNTTLKGRTKSASTRTRVHEQIVMSALDDKLAVEISEQAELDHTNLEMERKSSKSKASSLASSSQTLAKTLSSNKKGMTTSNSYVSVANASATGSGALVTGTESALEAAPIIENDSGAQLLENETTDVATTAATTPTNASNVLGGAKEPAAQTTLTTSVESTQMQQSQQLAISPMVAEADIDADEHDDDKMSSSSTTNPGDMSTLTAGGVCADGERGALAPNAGNPNPDTDSDSPDPLPKKLQATVNMRLKNDLVVTTLLAVIVFGLHCSTVFTVLQPDLNIVLYAFTGALGLLLHYVIPQMRKHMPWLCFARPILRQKEYGQFEVSHAPKVMWFEKVYIYLCMLERNVMFPLLVISAVTADAQIIINKFGIAWGTLVVAVCALKLIRNAYSDPTNQYLIVMFTVLFFRYDFAFASETFLIDYFFMSLAFRKCCDFLLKLQFIVTYIAPWQITWGSAFHAFAQPFSVPHSAMLFLQAGVSAILSTPLNPFLGSAIFLTSYVRPIKFWERDYNTRRIDHSNTRLSSQLERDLGADDNNLNSIFYEHLTRSLQHSLCGDLLLGRWGNVNQGDCFVLASDYLNCLVHIIELGNGLCTFQMRGLEFRGTYCQQREVEAITEDVEDNDGCCCCDPGHLPRILSVNAMFSTRWLAWQVVAAQYVLEGYSISDNLASATLQVFEYRKVLITYYLKSIIYYVIKNPKLEQWLNSAPIQEALQHTLSRQFVDLDPIFNYNLDEDFDFRAVGITRSSFCYVYLSWINYCYDKRKDSQNPTAPTATVPTTGSTAATVPLPPHTPTNNTSNAYNDSKSTPNLSTTTTTTASKSQSQQQLRTRPQKSATMSGSTTINSSEHIAISPSFANISRQTSESAPGLSGAGLSLGGGYMSASGAHAPLDNSFANSAATVGASISAAAKMPTLGQQMRGKVGTGAAPLKTLRKEASPTASATAATASNMSNGGTERAASEEPNRPLLKLKVPSVTKDSPIVSLCLALGLLARRSLANASHSSLTGVEFFLHGLHQLFKGDFRIQSPRDEWVFADMELLHAVVAPAVKMALKLQQDHISNPDEFHYPDALYEAIDTCAKDLVISHEADPVWRSAVLRGAPNLLALRHVMEDGSDEYRIIRLTKRFLSFRVIKLNRECVRGLWAGQQQELIYLRNRNPERGSIQNAKQALRNIINSSCDQPIGYPIYVSPLTTSYADTNEQLCKVIGGAITLESIKSNVLDWWQRIRERCRQGCSSGSAMETSNLGIGAAAGMGSATVGSGESGGDVAPIYISAPLYNTLTVGSLFSCRPVHGVTVPTSIGSSLGTQFGSDGAVVTPLWRCPVVTAKPALLAGLLNREREQELEREREREQLRGVGIRVSHSLSRSERERRVTLPIASTSNGGASVAEASSSAATTTTKSAESARQLEPHSGTGGELQPSSSSPRYAKMSSSSGSLGIGSIITTPGDYPRKSKGPISLTAAAALAANERSGVPEMSGKSNSADMVATLAAAGHVPRIGLYKKVVIIDDFEIFDRIDVGRRFNMFWPSEEMRAKGGRSAWKDWLPCIGMVGYVVHFWMPGHRDLLFRSPFSRVVYLVAMNGYYVPVGEFGIREYDTARDGDGDGLSEEEEMATAAAGVLVAMRAVNARRSSVQQELHELDELHQERERVRGEGLTPILGSSLESPTSHLMGSSVLSGVGVDVDAYTDDDDDDAKPEAGPAEDTDIASTELPSVSGIATTIAASLVVPNVQMRAVSSSSSEDEAELLTYEMQRREQFFNMWKLMSEHKDAELKEMEMAKSEERVEEGKKCAESEMKVTQAIGADTMLTTECVTEAEADAVTVEQNVAATTTTPSGKQVVEDNRETAEETVREEQRVEAYVAQLEQQSMPECSDV